MSVSILETIANEIGCEVITEGRDYPTKSMKEILIKKLENEIEYLKERNSLEYPTSETSKRFWRKSKDGNGKVCIKYKNSIWGFGEETSQHKPSYFKCEYTVEGVLGRMNSILELMKGRDEDDKIFIDYKKQMKDKNNSKS